MRTHNNNRIGKHARKSLPSRRRVLELEALEGRLVLSTYTVTSPNDSGTGTLRQAILDAEMDETADTIDFAASLAGDTITLTSNDTTTAYGPTALVISNGNITIDGSGAPLLQISGDNARRIFAVSSSSTLTLENITLTGGLAQGGAGGSGGVSGSSGAGGGGGGGAGLGGAIFNEGTLNVVQSTLSGNTAIGGSSALAGTQFGGGGGGSAIYNGGVGADYGAGGGGGVGGSGGGASGNTGGSGGANQSGTQAAAGSSGTLGGGGGGGSKAVAGGDGTAASAIGLGGGGGGGGGETTNVNGGAGGAGGFGAGGGGGGGAESNDGTGGAGGAGGFGGGGGGGGIYSYTGDTGAGGVGGFGGGNGNGGGTSSGGKKGGGGAGMGGAIFNDGGTVTITNSTLTGNTAQGGTGFTNGQGLGGAIFSRNGTLNTLNTTISANTATSATGVYVYADNATATAAINNTIIGGATNAITDFVASINGVGTDATSGVGNLIRSATGFSGTVVSTANPNLGSLANNTGPTLTMLPAAGSPVIDAGNNTAATGLTIDQRGEPRIYNSTVDIGAVEVQPATTAPAITSANSTTFVVASAGTFTVTSTGNPTAALSETGTLPIGVTFVDNGNGTATLAGTPAAGSGNTYSLTLTANNGVTPNATQSFTLTVNQAPAITSANAATFIVGSAGSFTITSTGYPTATLSETGALPSGVTFVNNADGTATLSGTPAAGSGGAYPLTVTADNEVNPNATQDFTLTVNQAPAITSANGTTFIVGSAGSFTITSTGYPSATLSETGTLPSGVTFVNNADGTATLSGTPAAGSGGTYPLTVTADNEVNPNATQDFTLTVNQAPAITSANGTTFIVGSAGSFTITSTGYPTATLSETGTLPSGVIFVNNADGTATLSGTPAAGSGGAYPLTVTADNEVNPNATQDFTLTVNQVPTITSADATTFVAGSAGSFTITSTGYPTTTLSETGTLPSGVTFVNNADGTATLSGTPAAGSGGAYPLTVTADNEVNPNATQDFTLTVNQAPAITSADDATFIVGSAGSFTITSTGYPSATLSETGALTQRRDLREQRQWHRDLERNTRRGHRRHLSADVDRRQLSRSQRHAKLHADGQPGPRDHQRRRHHVRRGERGDLHDHKYRLPQHDPERDRYTTERRNLREQRRWYRDLERYTGCRQQWRLSADLDRRQRGQSHRHTRLHAHDQSGAGNHQR